MGTETERIISASENISLYPSIVEGKKGGQILCAWYEYSSPVRPARSDIFCAVSEDICNFSEPVNISGCISYNNGPSVFFIGNGHYLVAWHSWREPGREPFTPDGDISNIWLSLSEDGFNWSEPWLAISNLSNTEYGALAGSDGLIMLFFTDRNRKRLCTSISNNGLNFSEPQDMPDFFGNAMLPDAAVGPDGTIYLVYIVKGEKDPIFFTKSLDGKNWQEPKVVSTGLGSSLSRPKISVDEQNRLWVACHTDNWGSFKRSYYKRVKNSSLEIHIRNDKTPGNACWTLNAATISSTDGRYKKKFSFGSDVFDLKKDITVVTEKDALYTKDRGYGTDKKVGSMLRELGDEITRTMFYGDEETVFKMDLEPGDYELELIYSSWIAARPGTTFSLNTEIMNAQAPNFKPDSIYIQTFPG
jgi:hypothetical protein